MLRLYSVLLKASLWSYRLISGKQSRGARFFAERERQRSKIEKCTLRPIWIHVSSAGEFEQALPVLQVFRDRYPEIPRVITFFSDSGMDAHSDKQLGNERMYYLPIDTPEEVMHFLDTLSPRLALFVKYEIWPNYFEGLKRRSIPLILVSFSLRQSHWLLHPLLKGFSKSVLRCVSHFYCLDTETKELLRRLGFTQSTLSGDTRIDRVLQVQAETFPFSIPEVAVVAGSTWREDDALLAQWLKQNPEKRAYIFPHELNRESIIHCLEIYRSAGLACTEFSGALTTLPAEGWQVVVFSKGGLLSRAYRFAKEFCWIGGGWTRSGIHNCLEAAVYGKPLLWGPEYKRYSESVALINCGGGYSVSDLETMENTLKTMKVNSGELASAYCLAQKGATQKIIDGIQAYLPTD